MTSAQAQLDALTSGPSATRRRRKLASAQAAATVGAERSRCADSQGDPAQAKATLASAQAQVHSAQTALAALLAPSAAALQQASDAVSSARAGLAAARAKLDAPSGVVTQLAAVGAVVQPGDVLYTLDGTHPVVLIDWRGARPGAACNRACPTVQTSSSSREPTGARLRRILADGRRALGRQTTAAVKRWQHALGLPQTRHDPLWARSSSSRAPCASPRSGDPRRDAPGRLAGAAGDHHGPAGRQRGPRSRAPDRREAGDAVSVVLPDGCTTPGTVSQRGHGRHQAPGGAGVGLHPAAHHRRPGDPRTRRLPGTLDQAPVTREHHDRHGHERAGGAGAGARRAPGGRVRRAGRRQAGTSTTCAVTLGIFANGWVQVSGAGLAAGQTVVVAQ